MTRMLPRDCPRCDATYGDRPGTDGGWADYVRHLEDHLEDTNA